MLTTRSWLVLLPRCPISFFTNADINPIKNNYRKFEYDRLTRWSPRQHTHNFLNVIRHDDVIKLKHFPRYWPFVREIHLSPVKNSPHKRPVTCNFDISFDQRLNKRLNKRSRRRWFETPERELWRHCNDWCAIRNDTFCWWYIPRFMRGVITYVCPSRTYIATYS